ncbi:thiol-disulfide oxidoreductase DCC family protein [bacterium SCSIO 12741]|nr:thiol-disulfide oxidoreductase DCC family protein [bacterium SCSIO 12741]
MILFDGLCHLCSGAVQFVLERDKHNRFHFAPLQGEIGQRILTEQGKNTTDFDSFVLVQNGRFYERSTAALKVAQAMPGLWPMLGVFLMVPRVIRDAVYNTVARNRYRWFGKKESCWIPRPEWTAKFL